MLLQTRPITSITNVTCEGIQNQATIWCNGNFRDSVPMVQTPLGEEFCQYRIDHILHTNFEGLDYQVNPGLHFTRNYQGRFYCNSSLLQWLWFDIVGFEPRLTCISMGGHQKVIDVDEKYRKGFKRKIDRLRRTMKFMRIRNKYIKQSNKIFDDVTVRANAIKSTKLAELSNQALLDLLADLEQQMDFYDKAFFFLTAASGDIFVLTQVLEKYVGDDAFAEANALLMSSADIVSANQGYDLMELARMSHNDEQACTYFSDDNFEASTWQTSLPEESLFKKSFYEYLKKYGHRATYEMDLSNPRWNEEPSYLIQCIKNYIDSGKSTAQYHREQISSNSAQKSICTKIPYYVRPFVKHLAKNASRGAMLKEAAKSAYAQYMEVLRYIILEIGSRLQQNNCITNRDDIFFCIRAEFIAIIKDEWDGKTLNEVSKCT